MKQQFNPKEYFNLKHRIEQLKSRVALDSGPEQDTAKRLLEKVEKKLQIFEQTHTIPKNHSEPEGFNTTSNFSFWNSYTTYKVHLEADAEFHEDFRSESEMIRDLGILYMIFGSTYQTTLNYHVYNIRFKKQTDKSSSFYRCYADIYEDDIKICDDIIIGFWPFKCGDYQCGDIEFASMSRNSIIKYNNGCFILYIKLLEGLKDIWNGYFDEHGSLPLLTINVSGYIENFAQNDIKIQLTSAQRREIITQVERNLGKLKSCSTPIEVRAYKSYSNLLEFLEESGVVYQVQSDGVYIWNYLKRNFGKLVGIEHHKARYSIYLL